MSDQEQNSMGSATRKSGKGEFWSSRRTELVDDISRWDNGDMQQYDDDLDGMEKSRHRESTSRSRSRSPVRRSRSRSRSHERHRDRARRINLISKRVIISNVPYEMKWQDIKDIFRKEVGEVQYVEMFETPDGKSRGSGIIEFKDKDTARKAIETMHRYKMKDRNIVVREERESDQNQNMGGGRGGGSGMMGGGGMGGGMGMMGNMGGGGGMMGNMGGGGGGGPGITPQLLQQLGVDGPVTNTVFVSNIDYKVTWKKLKDVFKLAGNVQRVEVMQSKDGKSRGMATVSFDTQLEALQAISMFNNQTLYDRPMRVKMDSTAAKKPDIPLPSGLKSIGMGLGLGGAPIQTPPGPGMGMGNLGGGGGGGGMGSGMSSVGGLGNMDSGMGMGSSLGGGSVGSMGGNLSGLGLGGGSMGGGSNVGGLGGLGNSGLSGMGLSGGLNDFNSGMGSGGLGSNFGNSLGGLNDNRMGLGSLSNSSLGGNNFSSSMMDNMGSGLGLGNSGSSNYGGSGLSSSYSDRGGSSRGRDSRDNDRSTRPDNCTVCVRNLPYSLKWQDLKEKFKAVADVRFAEIKTENGRSAGWGLVRFGNPDDAQRAISLMNRSRIDGREVDVKMYR